MRTTHRQDHDRAAQHRMSMSRRKFLRGMGVSIALPALGSMVPSRAFAAEASAAGLATTPAGAPLRAAFLKIPNGVILPHWWPEGKGREFTFNRTLAPLERVKSMVQVVGGLDHKEANPGPDGGGDHARGNGVFLTGVRLNKSATDIQAGISIDQAMANRVGHLTRFPSLELATNAVRTSGACDSGYACAYQYNISWQSATTPAVAETNPRLVFERLFGAGGPGERNKNLQRRRAEQRSVLDFVLDDARSMQRRLGSQDQEKLDQYLSGVRDIESRIERAESFGPVEDPRVEAPIGIPFDYAEYIELMSDILVLAFQTDSTRVATLMLAHDGSNRSFEHIGISEGHHDLSHHRNNQEWIDKVADIDLWYTRQFARFLEKLATTEDPDDRDGNSLLHNSMIVYGSGNADGYRHTHENLPVILAGAGGGTIEPGRYVHHGAKPMTNLFLSMADRMGIGDLRRFGDSTDRLSNL